VKTTLEIPDPIFRRAKSAAAHQASRYAPLSPKQSRKSGQVLPYNPV
jgi:hypothetical protein